MVRRGLIGAAAATAVAALALAPIAPIARAADHTWSGARVSVSPSWLNAGNWGAGGAPAPGDTIGTLTFPSLSCLCGASTNDVAGLTIGTLAIVDDFPLGQAYVISGNGITLTGGLSASPPPRHAASPSFRQSASRSRSARHRRGRSTAVPTRRASPDCRAWGSAPPSPGPTTP